MAGEWPPAICRSEICHRFRKSGCSGSAVEPVICSHYSAVQVSTGWPTVRSSMGTAAAGVCGSVSATKQLPSSEQPPPGLYPERGRMIHRFRRFPQLYATESPGATGQRLTELPCR